MPTKKTPQKAVQKPLSESLRPTKREREKLRKEALADMKKHGFKTPEELTAYYDKKRGY